MSIHILDDETDASVSFHGSLVDEIRDWLQLHYQVDMAEKGLSVAIDEPDEKKAEATD